MTSINKLGCFISALYRYLYYTKICLWHRLQVLGATECLKRVMFRENFVPTKSYNGGSIELDYNLD